MKKIALTEICIALFILLFTYTAASKFLDYNKFVFQMRLAPVPLMVPLAPILGWIIPIIEMIIALVLALGLVTPILRLIGLYTAVILLSAFEVYIITMLFSGSHLPCTCGGIISQMDWKQHLIFNGVFIIGGILSIKFSNKYKPSNQTSSGFKPNKNLSRA